MLTRRPGHGAGANTRRGVECALSQTEADVIVTLDGDGQHDPDDIPLLLEPILNHQADIVIGSRFLIPGYRIKWHRKLGIDIITWVLNIGARVKFSDGQCCFRTYRREVLEQIEITETGFGFSVEILVKARALNLRIAEVPVRCIYHECFESNSTLGPIRQGVSVLLSTIRWRIWEISHREARYTVDPAQRAD